MKMDWKKLLDNAWKDILKKGKEKGEQLSPYLIDYSNNIKKHLKSIESLLILKKYQFREWKGILLPKSNGEKRPLIIPWNLNDKVVLKAITSYFVDVCSDLFKKVDDVSYAYQKGKSTKVALLKLKSIHKKGNVLLKIDIKHFFDTIDKNILVEKLDKIEMDCYVKELIISSINPIVDYSKIKIEERGLFPKSGIPQGNSISNVLSNFYLNDFDNFVIQKRWNMVRYADDMVFSVSSEEEAKIILSEIEEYLLENLKLSIHSLGNSSDAKTAIYLNPQKHSMEYLGVKFDGRNLSLTDKSYFNLNYRIRKILENQDTTIEKEQLVMNSIKQWCGYYAFTDVKSNKLKNLNRTINYQIKKYQPSVSEVDVEKVMTETRKKQNKRWYKIKEWIKPEEGNEWLDFYYLGE